MARTPSNGSLAEKFNFYATGRNKRGCLLWEGSLRKDGYGQFWYRGQMVRAHRVAWELYYGKPNLHVLHECDNPRCVNPKHLFLGTDADNHKDKCRKQRQSRGAAHGGAVLTATQVQQIRRSNKTESELGKLYGISASTAGMVRRRQLWRHL